MDRFELRVNDIKQFEYCPRIVFYQYLMPVARKATFKMEEGKRAEALIDELEKRRTLKEYGLGEGVRRFHVSLHSERLGLSGKLDLLIESPEGYVPVDFKYSSGRPQKNHVYQLCAYALLLEDTYGQAVPKGYIYRIPGKEVTAVELTSQLKEETRFMMAAMREMIRFERMPEPTPFARGARNANTGTIAPTCSNLRGAVGVAAVFASLQVCGAEWTLSKKGRKPPLQLVVFSWVHGRCDQKTG